MGKTFAEEVHFCLSMTPGHQAGEGPTFPRLRGAWPMTLLCQDRVGRMAVVCSAEFLCSQCDLCVLFLPQVSSPSRPTSVPTTVAPWATTSEPMPMLSWSCGRWSSLSWPRVWAASQS